MRLRGDSYPPPHLFELTSTPRLYLRLYFFVDPLPPPQDPHSPDYLVHIKLSTMLKRAVSGSELACCVAVNHNIHMEAANFIASKSFLPPPRRGSPRFHGAAGPGLMCRRTYITADVLTDLPLRGSLHQPGSHMGMLGSGVLP